MNENAESRDRVTLLRDPAAPAGAIDILDINDKLPKAKTGSRYFSGRAQDGKFYVYNAHREKALQTGYDSEQEALDKAAEKNGIADDEAPTIQQ